MMKIKEFSLVGKISVVFIVVLVLISILSPFLGLKPYNAPSGPSLASPSSQHILGTDDLGIDIFAQLCNGTRISLLVGSLVAIISGFLGSLVGIVTGYYGGWLDKVFMRIIDILIAIPQLPLMIVLGSFFGPSIKNIVLVLSLMSWVGPARIVRSRIISLKEETYIRAARSYGAGFIHLTKRHFLRDIFPLVSISMMKLVNKAIVAEAGLSFIGLLDPTSKSWGIMLNQALAFQGIYFTEYWKWWIMSPLMALMLLILSIAFISRDFERIIG